VSPLSLAFRLAIFFVLAGALLFIPAGRLDLPWFWAVLAVITAGMAAGTIVALRRDPTLLAERARPGPGGKDPHLRKFAGAAMAAGWVVAGLDARFAWSAPPPDWLRGIALLLTAAAMALPAWAIGVNRFFSSDARIQRDRGHRVVTNGPYRYIRHPGYAGSALLSLAMPVALGSWWSYLPALVGAALILRRLLLEDRLLRAELEGYAEYAGRVPWRLVPYVW
jgi:protein-S-isoprenylcysteine O-methyltransferase Ste14